MTTSLSIRPSPPARSRAARRSTATPDGARVPFRRVQPDQRRAPGPLRHLRPLHRSRRRHRPDRGPAAARRDVVRDRGTQLQRARAGEITAEMAFIAAREGVARRAGARRGRPRPRGDPGQPQPPRERADDHRQGVRGEGQRQHRQLRGHLVDRRGGRQDGVGHPLGRRHHHGPVHRPATSTRPASGSCATPRCRSARCRSTRRWRRSTAIRPQLTWETLPRHRDRAVRAGRGLHDRARRGAAALRAADRQAGHRHRVARRFDHGGVVPGAPPGVVPVHPLRASCARSWPATTSPSPSATDCGPARSPTPTTRRSSPSCAPSAS